MISRLVLFGATGDLAGRYLLPALAALHAAGKLPPGFRVVGSATEDWEDATFRRHAIQKLEQHAAEVPAAAREAVVRSRMSSRTTCSSSCASSRWSPPRASGTSSTQRATDRRGWPRGSHPAPDRQHGRYAGSPTAPGTHGAAPSGRAPRLGWAHGRVPMQQYPAGSEVEAHGRAASGSDILPP